MLRVCVSLAFWALGQGIPLVCSKSSGGQAVCSKHRLSRRSGGAGVLAVETPGRASLARVRRVVEIIAPQFAIRLLTRAALLVWEQITFAGCGGSARQEHSRQRLSIQVCLKQTMCWSSLW